MQVSESPSERFQPSEHVWHVCIDDGKQRSANDDFEAMQLHKSDGSNDQAKSLGRIHENDALSLQNKRACSDCHVAPCSCVKEPVHRLHDAMMSEILPSFRIIS